MSGKKSWDIQSPSTRRDTAPRTPPPARASAGGTPVRTARAEQQPRQSRQPLRPVRVPRASKQPLAQRRKKAHRARAIAVAIAVLVLLGIVIAALWRPQVRIQAVEASEQSEQAVVALAERELAGSYLYVLPRNSVVLYPENTIRAAILEAEPSIAAVSMKLSSFSTLTITTTPRVAALTWCGSAPDAVLTTQVPEASATTSLAETMPAPEVQTGPACYGADAYGLIFKLDTSEGATASGASQGLPRFYAVLAEGAPDAPLGGVMAYGSRATDIVKFVRAIESLGLQVDYTHIRGDEADVVLMNNTRITYVIGREEEAARVAASALPSLSLADGVYSYVDLRFEGKAYAKRRGE